MISGLICGKLFRQETRDDSFLDSFLGVLSINSDLRKLASHRNCIVCAPISCSLQDEVSRDFLMSHIMIRGRSTEEYTSLKGEQVKIDGSDLVTGNGFPEPRRIKILNVERVVVGGDTLIVYKICRPFIGGLKAPEDFDEINIFTTFKYMAFFRSFPDTEKDFMDLDGFVDHLNFVWHQLGGEGFKRIKPSIESCIRFQWELYSHKFSCSEAECLGLGEFFDASSSPYLYVEQIIESYLTSKLHPSIYPWSCLNFVDYDSSVSRCIRYFSSHTQADLGVRSELQTTHYDAILQLQKLKDMITPIDKMMILKDTVQLVKEKVVRNINTTFPQDVEDIELTTDDIITILIWIVIQTPAIHQCLSSDLRYIELFHYVNSSSSPIGFAFCHFQIVVNWIYENASVDCREMNTISENYSVSSSSDRYDLGLRPMSHKVSQKHTPPISPLNGSSEVDDSSRWWNLSFLQGKKSKYDNGNNNNGNHDIQDYQVLEYAANDNIQRQASALASSPRSSRLGSIDSRDEERSVDRNNMIPFSTALMPVTSRILSIWIAQVRRCLRDVPLMDIRLSQSQKAKASKLLCFRVPPYRRDDVSESVNDFAVTSVDLPLKEYSCDEATVIAQLAAGSGYYSLISENEEVYTWGRPECGRLGFGAAAEMDQCRNVLAPHRLSLFDDKIQAIACGGAHMLAVSSEGKVLAWGDNRCGQLGFIPRTPSTSITKGTRFIDFPPSERGNVDHLLGESVSVGSASYSSLPAIVYSLIRVSVTTVACGANHSLALASDGRVYSWGRAGDGRLGQFPDKLSISAETAVCRPGLVMSNWSFDRSVSSPKSAGKPVVKRYSSTIIAIAAGYCHSIALNSDGVVFTWGRGTSGRLGLGSHCHEYLPKQVSSMMCYG